jgi:hypothetical protein
LATYASQIEEQDAELAQSLESVSDHNLELERLLEKSETENKELRKRVEELERERTVSVSHWTSTGPVGTLLGWLWRPRMQGMGSGTGTDEQRLGTDGRF